MKNGSLPAEVVEEHRKIRTEKQVGYPKQLNAIVNSLVPKDAVYGSKIDFNAAVNLKKFESLFRSQVITHQQACR